MKTIQFHHIHVGKYTSPMLWELVDLMKFSEKYQALDGQCAAEGQRRLEGFKGAFAATQKKHPWAVLK